MDCMSAASATPTLPPLTVRLLASSNPSGPNPEAATSATIALAESSTLNSMSAENPAKSPPIFALTDVSLAVTISTPSTFSTLSVAEIRAAAVSVIS